MLENPVPKSSSATYVSGMDPNWMVADAVCDEPFSAVFLQETGKNQGKFCNPRPYAWSCGMESLCVAMLFGISLFLKNREFGFCDQVENRALAGFIRTHNGAAGFQARACCLPSILIGIRFK
jgi:hypothetical protein